MTNSEFTLLANEVLQRLKMVSPIKTGNLRYNAIRMQLIDENTIKIYIDETIAPYAIYTIEPWISPKWNGKQNPNEKWWDNEIEKIINDLAMEHHGEVRGY